MTWSKTGATHQPAGVGNPDKGRAKGWLSAILEY